MSTTNNTQKLDELLSAQESLLGEIKKEARLLDSQELLSQNKQLTEQLRESEQKRTELERDNAEIKSQLSSAKNALFTKLTNEKLSVFTATQKRIDSYYYRSADGVSNRLKSYEEGCIKSINETIKAIDSYGGNEYDDLRKKLMDLQAETHTRYRQVEQYKTAQLSAAAQTNGRIGAALKNEPLSENEAKINLKQKSIESFVGLNILSKAGIFLFIVGIIMLGRFAYLHMSDFFKGSIIFLLGAVLIAIGEVFHKKEKTVFSNALISGGVAVLYTATATGYFAFHLYPVKITFLICIIVTAIAIALSNQLKSEVVCAFGTVGGYLPVVAAYMISFGSAMADKTFLPVSSVYFSLLAVVIFVMTYNKKWHVAQFIGYALHLVAIGGIASCAWAVRALPGYAYALPLSAGFAIISYAIYLLMPASKIIKMKPLSAADAILLALNTISGAAYICVTVRNCFDSYAFSSRVIGVVFLILALIYGVLMYFSQRKKSEASVVASVISSVSALIFSMLAVPSIFGMRYAAIAWVIEGLLLALISIEKRIKISETVGALCMALAVFAFMFCSFSEQIKAYSVLSVVSFGILVTAFWIYSLRGIIENKDPDLFSHYRLLELLTAAGSCGLIIYVYNGIIKGPSVNIYSAFTNHAVSICAVLVIAVILRLGILKCKASMVVSDLAGIASMTAVFSLLDIAAKYFAITDYYGTPVKCMWLKILNLILLVAINIGAELFFALSVSDIIKRAQAPAWVYTAAISVSSLMLITATVMGQFGVKFTSIIISALYIAAACVLLVIGFKKQYTVVRSGGLVLILVAFAKLCFVDTRGLDSALKIASYFAFGAILIVISYFYQRFSKKLESSVENENISILSDKK